MEVAHFLHTCNEFRSYGVNRGTGETIFFLLGGWGWGWGKMANVCKNFSVSLKISVLVNKIWISINLYNFLEFGGGER